VDLVAGGHLDEHGDGGNKHAYDPAIIRNDRKNADENLEEEDKEEEEDGGGGEDGNFRVLAPALSTPSPSPSSASASARPREPAGASTTG